MEQPKPALPFMSDKLDHLVTYTNLFESDSRYFKSINLGYRILEDMEAFNQGLFDLMPKDVTAFRQKSSEPQQFVLYLRSKDVNIKLVLNSITPKEWYAEDETAKSSKVYEIKIEYLGDLKLQCKVMDYLRSFEVYSFPRKEGVYDVNIQDMYMDPAGRLQTQEYNMTTENFDDVLLSLYPGIDMRAFLTAYHQSDENIAMFQGPPGTGKTSLLKLILRDSAQMEKADVHAIYVKDRDVLHQSAFWSMMSSKRWVDYLILDDLDHDLLPRDSTEYQNFVKTKEESSKVETRTADDFLKEEKSKLSLASAKSKETIVNQLLSYSDGLFQVETKVLITTNLESTKIDKALIRPGRCFDILRFPYMTVAHSLRIWKEEFDLSEDQFKACFHEVLEKEGPAISQALLVSEAKELQRKTLKGGYLIDKSISVRNKYM